MAQLTTKQILNLLGNSIIRAGRHGIPSWHLYAEVMGYMNLDTYQAAINLLVKSGLVHQSGHLLTINEKELRS